jgi:tetratricopeptide (TPR) repeat protein
MLKSSTNIGDPGRNDPCPCGSGRKYKHCCADKKRAAVSMPTTPANSVASDLRKAISLREAGCFAESLDPMERAVRAAPGNASIHHDLGLTYLKCDRIDDAIVCFQRAVALKHDFAYAHYMLGVALELRGRTEGAIAAHQRAGALKPSLFDAHHRLANLLLNFGRRKEATDAFRSAASAAPNTTEGRLSLVHALLIEDRDLEAETTVRRALTRDPGSSVGHLMLGSILAQAGRFSEAAVAFERSVALNPSQGSAYYNLVRSRTLSKTDRPLVDQMLAVAPTVRQAKERVLLELALGKAFEDLKEYGAAIAHLVNANRIKKTMVPFDREGLVQRIDELIARFTPDFLTAHTTRGSDAKLPILILGMPRSGTTLVEQIISSHPQVAGGDELHFWNRRGLMFAQTTDMQIPHFQLQAAHDYLVRLHRIAPNAMRVTDKMPFNFLWAGLIHLVFPRATIVHCRRSPIDTCLSVFATSFMPRSDFSTDPNDLVFYYRQYMRLMAHWRAVLPSDRFIEVDYEELVADPEPVSRRLIATCGLDLHPACLQPERNERLVKSASLWQVRQPIHRGSVARWRHYEPWLGDFRELLSVKDIPEGEMTGRAG